MGNTIIETGYPFELLHEEVSTSDLFSDKTHENVTNVIYRIIDSLERGITIGMEGGWGAGKSTVVELLRQKVTDKNNKETLFFVFDAWAHEGDPLRRIFLESLVNEIDKDKKDNVLNELLGKISSRTKTVEVRTERSASRLGKRIFLSTLAIPIGSAILSSIDYSTLLWPWSENAQGVNYTFLIGLLLSLAPFLMLIYWGLFGDKGDDGKVKWDFMESDATENYVQDITEDGERTSIEFERYFESILSYVLGEGKRYQRAIIVIDNLDRVASEHAISIWSTLQTFFQHRSRIKESSPEWMKCLWFVVPYDRDGLSRIWDDDSKSSVANSFLSKSFQIIAEVPAPVMSAWYEYCSMAVNKALKDWPENDRQEVLRIYQQYGGRLDVSPTPRDIHSFVNQVGITGMRWGGVMSAESIAMYAALRQEMGEGELRGALLKPGLPERLESIRDPENVKMELSGILFGVDKNKGIQLLISPEIRTAMIEGDGETISEMINQHGEAFWIVWEAIKDDVMVTESHSEDYRIGATLAVHGGMLGHKDRIVSEIRRLENVWKKTGDKWELIKYDYAEPISKLSELVEDKNEVISWCNKVTTDKLEKLLKKVSDEDVSDDELANLSKLSGLLAKSGLPLKNLKYTALGKSEWVFWVKKCKELDISIPSVRPKSGTITEISAELLKDSNTVSLEMLEILSYTLQLSPNSTEWKDVSSALALWGSSASRELGDKAAYNLMLGIIAKTSDQVAVVLRDCIKSQQFWVRGSQEDLVAVKIYPILVACAIGENIQQNDYVSDEVKCYWKKDTITEDELRFVADVLQENGLLHVIWELAKNDSNAFAIAFAKNMMAPNKLFSHKSGLTSIEEYDWLEDDESEVIARLCKYGNLDDVKDGIKADPISYAYSLYLLRTYGDTNAKRFAKDTIESMTEEQWRDAFENNSYALNVALDSGVSPTYTYTDALRKFIIDFMTGSSTVAQYIWDNFDQLLVKTLDTDIQLTKLSEAYFNQESDKVDDSSFSVISNAISSHVSEQSPAHLMERVGFWIDNESWDRIRWLLGSGYRLDGEPSAMLASRVNAAVSAETEEDLVVLLKELASAFNIKIMPATEPKDDEESDVKES